MGKKNSSTLTSSTYLSRLAEYQSFIEENSLIELSEIIKRISSSSGRIFIAGNGGSCSLADHFATDLGVGNLDKGNHVNAISLSSNNAVITASANDYNYKEIFTRQLKVSATEKDMLIVISSSGNSENLVCAVEFANSKGMFTVGILGFDGGQLKSKVKSSVHIPTMIGDYGPTEDIHSTICHIIASKVRF